MVPDPPHSAVVTLPNDTEILITRKFAAPRALVYEAWTMGELVPQWYGPPHLKMSVCEIDLRVGGAWRYVLEDPATGRSHGFAGQYIDITPPELLIFTERHESIPGSDHVLTLIFTEADGITTILCRDKHASPSNRDAHLAAGMEAGMQVTLDRLGALLARLLADNG